VSVVARPVANLASVLIVGAGYFARFHAEAWVRLGARVVAVVDRDLARAHALARQVGSEAVFDDAQRALDHTQADLVDTVLPPEAQRAVVVAALERRRPTICQKPFGRDLADALAMTSAAKAAGVPLVVHENFRFAPWFRECRRLIDQGRLGRLHGISFRLRPGDGQGLAAYLDRQPYFQTMPQLMVRETAIHFIDTFRYLMGEVRAVTAHLRRLNPVITGEDAALIHFEFDDQRTGVFDGNRLNEHPASDQRRTMGEMWLEGEGGVLRLDGDARLWFKPHGQPEHIHLYDNEQPGPFGGAVAALQAHVLAHLQRGEALENTAADYLANLHAQMAIYRAGATNTRIVMAEFLNHDLVQQETGS
jgi:D-apiose dehydrogenase